MTSVKVLSRGILIVCGLMAVTLAQSRTKTVPPDEVLKRFLSMETQGQGLKPTGWKRMVAGFFVHPTPLSQSMRIAVIAYQYGVRDSSVKGNTAQVYVGYERLGLLDTGLRFIPATTKIETRSMCNYNLTLTAKHWALDDDKHESEVTGDPEWRIENHECEMLLTPTAAVRYVTEARNKATDPATRHNADKSLSLLRGYVRSDSKARTK